jgi:hypothetical protein
MGQATAQAIVAAEKAAQISSGETLPQSSINVPDESGNNRLFSRV